MYRGSFFIIPLAILTITIYTASSEHCITSQPTLKFYEELNCIPTKDKTKNCATSFNCSSLFNHNKDKCYFGGKEYSIGEELDDGEHPGNNCIESCRCNKDSTNSAQFTCLNVQCPEKFKPLRDNCMNTYSHEICCAVSTLCDNDLRGLATCEYGGKVYKEGAVFYPKEKPCKKCICQEGFDGKLESPWCEDVSCNLEIQNVPDIQEFCAPVYKGRRSCCPSYFYCQSSSDIPIQIIERSKEAGSSRPRKNHDLKCKFGNMTIEIGQKITPPRECIECSCDVPPFVTCIRDGKCSKAHHNH